jgi:hypothetical protein
MNGRSWKKADERCQRCGPSSDITRVVFLEHINKRIRNNRRISTDGTASEMGISQGKKRCKNDIRSNRKRFVGNTPKPHQKQLNRSNITKATRKARTEVLPPNEIFIYSKRTFIFVDYVYWIVPLRNQSRKITGCSAELQNLLPWNLCWYLWSKRALYVESVFNRNCTTCSTVSIKNLNAFLESILIPNSNFILNLYL